MFPTSMLSDIYLQLALFPFRSLLVLMNSAESVIPYVAVFSMAAVQLILAVELKDKKGISASPAWDTIPGSWPLSADISFGAACTKPNQTIQFTEDTSVVHSTTPKAGLFRSGDPGSKLASAAVLFLGTQKHNGSDTIKNVSRAVKGEGTGNEMLTPKWNVFEAQSTLVKDEIRAEEPVALPDIVIAPGGPPSVRSGPLGQVAKTLMDYSCKHAQTKDSTAPSALLGSKTTTRTSTSFGVNRAPSRPQATEFLTAKETIEAEALFQAGTSPILQGNSRSTPPQGQSAPQWPSIPHEDVGAAIVMPVKRQVQPKNVSPVKVASGGHQQTNSQHWKSSIGQEFYRRHVLTRPVSAVPRRVTCAQPQVIPFGPSAPLLLPATARSKRIYPKDFTRTPTAYAVDSKELLPIPVTAHVPRHRVPLFGHWVNETATKVDVKIAISRLSSGLATTTYNRLKGVLSNSDSIEEFMTRHSNPQGLHKSWQQILDDLERDMNPFQTA